MQKKWAYYNEFDPKAAAWLRELIKLGEIMDGEVDERSIADVQPDDVRGFIRVGFFAGIGGWDLALRKAGWPEDRPVWHGSCPCQAFSCAGQQKGFADERDLWPVFFNLIRECRPDVVLGEQVENAVRHGWLDRLYADLEGEDYACGSVVLGAHSAGADHIRQRIYWVADAEKRGGGASRQTGEHGAQRTDRIGGGSESGGMADAERQRHQGGERNRSAGAQGRPGGYVGERDGAGCVANTVGERGRGGQSWNENAGDARQPGQTRNFWSDAVPHLCKDGKYRRFEPRIFKMVDVVSLDLGYSGDFGFSRLEKNKTRLQIDSESCILNWFKERKDVHDGSSVITDTIQGLSNVFEKTRAETFSKLRVGEFKPIQQEKVLQPEVHGRMDGGEDESSESEKLSETVGEESGKLLHELRIDKTTRSSSYRFESREQLEGQLGDFVRTLSHAETLERMAGNTTAANKMHSLWKSCKKTENVSKTLSALEKIRRSLVDENFDILRVGFDESGRLTFFTHAESGGVHPLAHGLPRGVGYSGDPRLQEYVNSTAEARVMRLKGYGNAINVETAAMFIRACEMELNHA